MAQDQVAGLVVLLCGCLLPTAGALVGAAQWMLLRKHLSRARWWLLANAGGWTLGLFAGALLSAIVGSALGQSGNVILLLILLVIVGGIVGVIAGGVTGFALMRLLKTEPGA